MSPLIAWIHFQNQPSLNAFYEESESRPGSWREDAALPTGASQSNGVAGRREERKMRKLLKGREKGPAVTLSLQIHGV